MPTVTLPFPRSSAVAAADRGRRGVFGFGGRGSQLGIGNPTRPTTATARPRATRRTACERLSWEHHRILAKLPEDEITGWIAKCEAEEDAGRRMFTRRLRKSLALGRIATAADTEPEPADKGVDNHIPFVNRLALWWRKRQ